VEENLGILDSSEEHPHSKLRRYLITAAVFIVLVAGGAWYLLRYHQEKTTVRHFLDAIVTGHMDQAYAMWKAGPSYSLKDFLEDFGPRGYYGPIKSYHFEDAERPPKGGSGVIVVVEVSPDSTFPAASDGIGQGKTKEVRIWVEFKDQSMSFPP